MTFRSMMAASLVLFWAGPALADYTLTVLHTNDFHARFEPISKYDSGCSAENNAEGKCLGGLHGWSPRLGPRANVHQTTFL